MERGRLLGLGLNEGCAPSMGANLWGVSPLWEYRLGLIVSKDNHEPKARAMPRGIVRRKPECKRCEAEPGPLARRGLQGTDRNRMVKAEGCEASWHMTAKPTGTQPTVNAALVHRQFAFLPGEIYPPWRRDVDGITAWCSRTRNDLAQDRAARSDCEQNGSEPSVRAARLAVRSGSTISRQVVSGPAPPCRYSINITPPRGADLPR